MRTNKHLIKRQIEDTIRRFAVASSRSAYNLVKEDSLKTGKLYEAYALSIVIEKLATEEDFQITLAKSNHIHLKSSAGPINRRYPHFNLRRCRSNGKSELAEVWTDVEFTSLSYALRGNQLGVRRCDYHELDILVTDCGISGRPQHNQIWLGVECKNTRYSKRMLREVLGIRRELSLFVPPKTTRFREWPRQDVPADPPSCLMVFSTDKAVKHYLGPGRTFGIDFKHAQL